MAFLLAARDITGVDPDASKVPPVACEGSESLTIGALCDTKGAQITVAVSWVDSMGNYLGSSGPFTLVAEDVASWDGRFRAFTSDGGEPVIHVGGHRALVQVMRLAPVPANGKPAWSLTAGADAR